MTDFKPGEIVDITIRGARVSGISKLEHCELDMTYSCDSGEYLIQLPLGAPGVTVEHVAPADWPPQPGDLWRDRDGDTWYALLVDDDDTADETYVVLRPGRSSKHPSYVHSDEAGILRTYGPLALVYREGQEGGVEAAEDGTPATYPTPGSEISEQPGYVVGNCGHRVAGSEWRAGFRTCERCPAEGGDEA